MTLPELYHPWLIPKERASNLQVPAEDRPMLTPLHIRIINCIRHMTIQVYQILRQNFKHFHNKPCWVAVFLLVRVIVGASWPAITTIRVLRAVKRSSRFLDKWSPSDWEKSRGLGIRKPGINTETSPMFPGLLLFPPVSVGVDTKHPISSNSQATPLQIRIK